MSPLIFSKTQHSSLRCLQSSAVIPAPDPGQGFEATTSAKEHSAKKYMQTFRQRQHYALFTSTVKPTVHTNPSQKRTFSKTLFKLEVFENDGFEVSCGRETF